MAESAEVLALPPEGGAAPLGPQPGEVWSLWDMLRAYAHEFAQIDRILEFAIRRIPIHGDIERATFTDTGQSWREWAQDQVNAVAAHYVSLPAGSAVRKQLARAQRIFSKPSDFHTALAALNDLQSRFCDELEDLQFLHITPALTGGLGDTPPFGEVVEQAFPSAGLEIRDAARCLALGQGTACVFHCMRALEPVLIALGAKFNVDVQENWNTALNAIEAAVRDRDSKKQWPSWKDDEPFYMEACTHFFIIKNAWRNHTMHLRLRFGEADALSVYDHTRAFMQHLATRLSEDVEGASPGQSSA